MTAIFCLTLSLALEPRRVALAGGATSLLADERGLVALDQAVRELTNPFTVMSVAAHPEDIDFGALAYYRKKLGARSVIVLATRGEARENINQQRPSNDSGVAATREALEAAHVAGADVYFLNLPDFGYSKSAEESLSVWGQEEALRRLVRAIRLLRPDVIITNHSPGASDGHHSAIAQLSIEAFEAAGDAKRFPEPSVEAWQPSRLFKKSSEIFATVAINLSEYDYARGLTYAQIAAEAARRFRLQASEAIASTSYYRLVHPASNEKAEPGASLLTGLALPENLARSIAPPRVGDLGVIDALLLRDRLIEALKEKLIEKRAEGSPAELHTRYGAEFFRVIRFTEALERALALALGLSFEIRASDRTLAPGQKLTVRLQLHNGSNRRLQLAFHYPETLTTPNAKPVLKTSDLVESAPGATATKEIRIEVAQDTPLTLPHSAHLFDEQYYPLGSSLPGSDVREPFGNRLLAAAEVDIGQTTISLPSFVRLDSAPAVEVATLPFVLLKDWNTTREFTLPVRMSNRTPGPLAGALWVVPLALTAEDYEPTRISFTREDEEVTAELKLKLPILKPPLVPDVLIEFRREKPAAPDRLGSAKVTVKVADIAVAEQVRVGHITAGDTWLPISLSALGVDHSEVAIKPQSVVERAGNADIDGRSRRMCDGLKQYDTIIIDSIAYYTRPEILSHNDCLLEYVRQGGNLITLYQQPSDWNSLEGPKQPSPFPIRLSIERITVETAPVRIIDPSHVLMSTPNKITEKDFEGWVRQRAVFLPKEWSSQYNPLLESADPGEEANLGGLLVATAGEGTYVYTSFDWQSQLLSMNPGAYRVLANLISFPKVKQQEIKLEEKKQ